ncbi:FHS family L-fucose permease-like MFS transporter [Haloferula luteola]|uniref:FHS family L-fucose permease-like MFS transporter n=1 Tax=Haloferula luteola TaxID=595692 RepID=A0A840V2P2_9BACT|nr:L-fucose:H+ symporter permease [Haloferula luteola]MBB5349934.1 FHS family L-fucose permease-like MFS transporter [Haloferula luteola]
MSKYPSDQDSRVVPAKFIYPFIFVTSLFALWGFANDITNPLVRAFKEIFLISNAQSSLVQWAFYGGYATMAIPAALVIRKLSYKWGILIGLGLYATGALLTIPASMQMNFNIFLVGFYVLTFGLAFLETSANPYILSMGSPETATQRLNLAQAFNPMGSLTGMLVASLFILPNLKVAEFRSAEINAHPEYKEMLPSQVDGLISKSLEDFASANPAPHLEMVKHDLNVVMIPYATIAIVVLLVLVLFSFSKMPNTGHEEDPIRLSHLLKRLWNFHYVGGVIAQTFYVGAQIMCWTFIIHYGMTLVGLSAAQAQNYNIAAMVIFLTSRFICTFLLKYLNPGVLLGMLAIGGVTLTLGAVLIHGMPGLYCLIGVSACMSLMFPTIYSIALDGLSSNHAKLGSAGLIFAIVGGAFMPRMQGAMIDGEGMEFLGRSLESIRVSFFLPAICFVVIACYGFLCNRIERVAHH